MRKLCSSRRFDCCWFSLRASSPIWARETTSLARTRERAAIANHDVIITIDRLNRVKVGKATSDWNVMKCGCPQGSSFGPTLWNLYQNDLSYHINEIANLNMYADDHQMYIVGSGMSIMCTNVEKEGNSALKWHKNNYLLSNPEKLNAMHVVWLSFHCWCHASLVIIVSRFAHTGSLISYGLKKRKFWHWQKNVRISCSRNACKYTWEKTARISSHYFETNGQP